MRGGEKMYKDGIYCGCKYRVDELGDCYTQNGKGEYIHRNWRYNANGYPIVSACGVNAKAEKIQRSLQVHILVAREFVDGWFDGAEVNHKDFNRANPAYWNLEWVTHAENIHYSTLAGKYKGRYGERNSNYGNNALHKRYSADCVFAKEKQSRPRGQNGKAKKCCLYKDGVYITCCACQRDAVDYVISCGDVRPNASKEHIIKQLKTSKGYKGWHLSFNI